MSLSDYSALDLIMSASQRALSTFDQIEIEKESIFFLELHFSYKFKKWLRYPNGDWSLIESYPIAPSSSYSIKIASESFTLCYYFLDWFLSDIKINASVRPILANKIASFLDSLAEQHSCLGFCAVAQVEIVNQQLVDMDEIHNLINTAADRSNGYSNVRPSRKDQVSGDSEVCLEELSGATKDIIRLTCDHTETANQQWVEKDEIHNLITAAADRRGGDSVVSPSRKAKVSGECEICLEEISGATKDMIRLTCDHISDE